MNVKAQEKENGVIVTPEGRASFVHVYAPNPLSEKGDFGLSLIFDKTPENLEFAKMLKNKAKDVAVEKWGDKLKNGTIKLRELPLHDGTKKSIDGYGEGKFFINCSTRSRPGVVGIDGKPILVAADVYSGCHVRISINVYAWDNKFGKGVSFGLNNVQKLREGEPFGGGTNPDDDFEPVVMPENDSANFADTDDDLFGPATTSGAETETSFDPFA